MDIWGHEGLWCGLLLHDRSDHIAGTAPGGIAVDDDEVPVLGVDDEFVELGLPGRFQSQN